MTGPNDALPAADSGEVMSPERVAAMERRLLEAFARHHAQASDRSPRAQVRWVAAAAALIAVTAGGVAWRGRHGDRLTPRSAAERPVSDVRSRPPVPLSASAVADATRGVQPSAAGGVALTRPHPRLRPRRTSPVDQSAAFVSLPGAAGLPTFESGSIVRMDLQLSSLAAFGVDISAARGRSPVQADLLVGQDGEPRAIRIVNVSSNPSSSSRSRQ